MSELGHEGHPHLVVSSDRFSQFLYRVSTRSPYWAGPAAILLCFAGGISYTLAVHASGYDAFTPPTCIVKLTTGFDCPGCGGTRALWFLLHGDLPAAARSHLMAVFVAPYLAYAYLAWAVNVVTKGRRLPTLRLSPIAISLFLLAWGAFSVLRNLPWAPFTWLFV